MNCAHCITCHRCILRIDKIDLSNSNEIKVNVSWIRLLSRIWLWCECIVSYATMYVYMVKRLKKNSRKKLIDKKRKKSFLSAASRIYMSIYIFFFAQFVLLLTREQTNTHINALPHAYDWFDFNDLFVVCYWYIILAALVSHKSYYMIYNRIQIYTCIYAVRLKLNFNAIISEHI